MWTKALELFEVLKVNGPPFLYLTDSLEISIVCWLPSILIQQ